MNFSQASKDKTSANSTQEFEQLTQKSLNVLSELDYLELSYLDDIKGGLAGAKVRLQKTCIGAGEDLFCRLAQEENFEN